MLKQFPRGAGQASNDSWPISKRLPFTREIIIPIYKLLSRIRWDTEYGKGDFKIGNYDRVEDRILIVPLKKVCFESSDHFSLEVLDDSTELHMVPLHRIRQVYRDGEIIWERPAR